MELFRKNKAYRLSLYLFLFAPIYLMTVMLIIRFLAPYVIDIDYMPNPFSLSAILYTFLSLSVMPVAGFALITSLILRFMSTDQFKKWWDFITLVGGILVQALVPSVASMLKVFDQGYLYTLVPRPSGRGLPIPPVGGYQYDPTDLASAAIVREVIARDIIFYILIFFVIVAVLIALKYLRNDIKRREQEQRVSLSQSAFV